MNNYFSEQNNEPILVNNPNTNKRINIEPLFLGMSELADKSHEHTPQALSMVVDDAIRHLAVNVPSIDPALISQYRQMMDRLYNLRDMFDAMFVVK